MDATAPADAPLAAPTLVTASATATAPPLHVWDVLTVQTPSWWREPYLSPAAGGMHIELRLGGPVWAGGSRHGTVRAVEAPTRLEIGSVLVPGAHAGSITFSLSRTALGSIVRVDQLAYGEISDEICERMTYGWTTMLTRLGEIADAM